MTSLGGKLLAFNTRTLNSASEGVYCMAKVSVPLTSSGSGLLRFLYRSGRISPTEELT